MLLFGFIVLWLVLCMIYFLSRYGTCISACLHIDLGSYGIVDRSLGVIYYLRMAFGSTQTYQSLLACFFF